MAPKKNQSILLLIFNLIIILLLRSSTHTAAATPGSGGSWVLLHRSIGISAMHMQVLRNNKVIMFDRTDFGNSNISLPDGKCRFDETLSPVDCSAHSVLYDVASNTIRPLLLQTNTWCSSGSLDADGVLIQTGGHGEGEKIIRAFRPCDDVHDKSCDWIELYDTSLMNRRWYASNQILPDGRIVIVGGRRVFTYEFFPKSTSSSSQFDNRTLDFLTRTRDPDEENNLYPFLHLLPDGNLFIFANNRSILFDYSRNIVVKDYPPITGGDPRNYPATGSSVLLPLHWSGSSSPPAAEVMVCGGAPAGAFAKASNFSIFVEASRTCGRLKVSDPVPKWVMEHMPGPRLMSDMILLPTGDVVLINGASKGSAGWHNARDPVYSPFLYQPSESDSSRRFVILPPSSIARMYHSTAALLPDGRILVGGSNPHPTYNFTGEYPTRLSLEAFHPGYLDADYAHLRPSITAVKSSVNGTVSYKEKFAVSFAVRYLDPYAEVSVVVIAPSFSTHSFGMNQRVVGLGIVGLDRVSDVGLKMSVVGPNDANVAPPGYYMMFVVHHGVPSVAVWVKIR